MPSIGSISPPPRTDGTGGVWAGLAEATSFTSVFTCSLEGTKEADLGRANQKIPPNTPAATNIDKRPATAREDRAFLLIRRRDWGLKSNLCSLSSFLSGVAESAWPSFFTFSF